eukprot:m.151482 g.151482  ORF g.151482 m.151482 type:complete len:333 (+) comp17864_c0_seq2:285-1283(+)
MASYSLGSVVHSQHYKRAASVFSVTQLFAGSSLCRNSFSRPFSTTTVTFESLRVKQFKEEKLPGLITEKRLKQMRSSLKLLTPNGYKKFFELFEKSAAKGLHNTTLCAEALGSIYCPDKQVAFVEKYNNEWMFDGDVRAALINLKEIMADVHGAKTLWSETDTTTQRENVRLVSLRKRKPKVLGLQRAEMIYKAARFGCNDDARTIFESLKKADALDRKLYEVMLWGCGSYASQLEHWALMETAAAKEGWRPSIDAFNAVLWQLVLENNTDEVHKVFEQIQKLELDPNDRTLHIMERAGEYIIQQKKEENGDLHSWNTVVTKMPIPRRSVGF